MMLLTVVGKLKKIGLGGILLADGGDAFISKCSLCLQSIGPRLGDVNRGGGAV